MYETSGRGLVVSVWGVEVDIRGSWVFVSVLMGLGMGLGHLPRHVEGISIWMGLACGFAVSMIVTLSLLAHEMGHCLVARRSGLTVPGITFSMLGGFSKIRGDADRPWQDLGINLAGPAANVAVVLLCFGAVRGLGLDRHTLGGAMVVYTMWINAGILLFNLIPGMPLDGGRILRSLLWLVTGSFSLATRVAVWLGVALGFGVMAWGSFRFMRGSASMGMWYVFIGALVAKSARTYLETATLRLLLRSSPVGRVALEGFVAVPAAATIHEVVEGFFLKYGYGGFPVVEGDRVVGIVGEELVRKVPAEKWGGVRVSEVMFPAEDDMFLRADAPVSAAMDRLEHSRYDRLVVRDAAGVPLGVATKRGIRRFGEMLQGLQRGVRAA